MPTNLRLRPREATKILITNWFSDYVLQLCLISASSVEIFLDGLTNIYLSIRLNFREYL